MRRLYGVLVTLFSLILMLGVAPAPLADVGANSQPSAPKTATAESEAAEVHHKSGVPTGTQIIWCGLWNGSNFNFTDSCEEIGENDQPQQMQHMQQVTTHVHKSATATAPKEETSSSTPMGSTNTTTAHVSASATATISRSSSDTDNDADTDTAASQQTQTSTPSATNESTQKPVMSAEPTSASNTTTTTAPASQSTSTGNTCTTDCGNGTQTVPTGTAIIWCGLWQGSNFNVSGDCANIGDGNPTVTLPAADPPSGSSPSNTAQANTASSSDPPATMTASDPPASTSGGAYAALGDSVAAGLGLPLPANADASTTACGRSAQGYPNLVASSMNLSLTNVSCSGTTFGDLLTSENVNGVEQSPQLDQAFAHGTPKDISITAGANDIEWSFFLKQCAMTNCADMTNTVAVNGLLVALQAKMLAALSSIQARSHGTPPRTVVTGYYQPVSAACTQMTGNRLSSANIAWIQAATNALNQTIKQTTQQFSFARFAHVSFAGHDLCSSNPWVQGLNAAAPFHPTAQGQQEIAKDVEAAMSQ